jgi:putative transposase
LFEARKRFSLCALNYIATSNHVHLLVCDRGKGENSLIMPLISGCTTQAYNQREQRSGVLWQDSYQATSVDSEEYLARFMVYIDLNMVRAGVAAHPGVSDISGYRELLDPRAWCRVAKSL